MDKVIKPTQTTETKPFTLKKWNLLALWSWDVECDICAICRVQLMDACLRCQTENKRNECLVVWGECNHSFHNCCMALWVKQNNRCPLCQQCLRCCELAISCLLFTCSSLGLANSEDRTLVICMNVPLL